MTTVTLNATAKEELAWWIKILELSNGRDFIQPPSQILMKTDASKKGWGAVCQGIRTGGPMVKEGTGASYKSFRTFSNKIFTSNLQQNDELQISTYPSRQPNCFELPLKDGRVKEPGACQSFEEDLGLPSQTSDHDYCRVPPRLPKPSGSLGVEKSKGFHRVEIMSTSIPENVSECLSTRDRSICFSVVQSAPSLLLMEARPKQFAPRCVATNLVPQTPFPPFSLIHRAPRKVELSMKNHLLLPQHPTLLRNPQGEKHTLFQNQTMRLAAWIITGNIWLRKEFQKGLQTLSFHQEERVLTQIIVPPGISGLAGVINRKLIHSDVL